ncbi:di-heme oxidoredictase family protein [Amaricoccus macauensis]|uniref:di-heme oxidoredictase family protein n=1 Tax=Amaricoccus macauensis TaxID=57001 RepID=UPI003C7EA1D9
MRSACLLPLLGLLPVAALAGDVPAPVDQHDLNRLLREGEPGEAFLYAFEAGDELTETSFDATRGVGAHIGEGRRFTRFPRADLDGPKEWANHFPPREGGANATSCIACHNAPFANGAGDVALNVVVDPNHTGDPSMFLERNTLPLFALGIPQRLAEEISSDLYEQRDAARERACATGSATAQLASKGVDYGILEITRVNMAPCKVEMDTSKLDGIDGDLVIKPFGWKGNHATIRGFTRDAAHNELGLQAVELVGDEDGDFDGVLHELSVGDMTALTIYMAALERPVSTLELAELEIMNLTSQVRADIHAGEELFEQVRCATCHVPEMTLLEPVFREPSNVVGFHDTSFPDGSPPLSHGLSPEAAIAIDLTTDQPNNQIVTDDGKLHLLGGVPRNADGTAVVRWFTDFKRHDMGEALADPDDALGLGAEMFLTRSLAGVASTGPWLHDGRATSLEEAILAHGGEAEASASLYSDLEAADREKIIGFLESLVMFEAATEEAE